MPNLDWICTACQANNLPYTDACKRCKRPAAPEHYIRYCICGTVLNDKTLACEQCQREELMPQEEEKSQPTSIPGYWDGDKYIPNQIPLKVRVWSVFLSVVMLVYGGYSVFVDDLFLPAKGGGGVHLHGLHAWVMYAAMVAGSVSMLSVVADHFDHRPNENLYQRIEKIARYTGWTLVLLMLVLVWYARQLRGI